MPLRKLFTIVFLLGFFFSYAQIEEKQLDDLIQKTLTTFDVPGISVGIVKDGKLVYAKGFGERSLTSKQPMNEKTLVGVASNSKGFTATALAILVDEGKLQWDDKVTDYIPEFQSYDSYITSQITIKDLVTHRTGLGLGQGDLMFFPEGGTLSIQDIIYNVRYLKPKHSFRNTFDYNNIMFIVAGEVITRISGKSWAEFIEDYILKPVGMTQSHGSYLRAKKAKSSNMIDAHAPVDGKVTQVPHDWNETANAAGGIISNIEDMALWANCLMNGFTTKDGKKLVSDKQIKQLWEIQQPITVSKNNPYNSHFYGYGLGWFLTDVNGHFQVHHTGGLIGTVTQFTLIPDLKLGIVVLTNQQSGAAFNTITNTIKDAYFGVENRDWFAKYDEQMTNYFKKVAEEKAAVFEHSKTFAKQKQLQPKASQFVGVYNDPWFGDIEITENGNGYRLTCKTSPRLKGTLLPYSNNVFIVKWDDRSYDADAFIIFTYDENGTAQSATMKPISSITDFSFDFEDLYFNRKTEKP